MPKTPATSGFLEDLLPYLLQRASFLITREFHRTLALNQVSVSRWRLLAWLSEHQPFSVGELSEQLMLRQPTVTKLVNDAVADGLVRKQVAAQDRRRLEISLTPTGRKLVTRLKREARHAEQATVATYAGLAGDGAAEEDIAELKARLKRLIERFDP